MTANDTIIQSVKNGTAYQVFHNYSYYRTDEVISRSFMLFGAEDDAAADEVSLPAEVISIPAKK